ncbi:MAG: inositol monophosphatase [Clostridia bacterium]|nr:inositol monophosphatase [Clostridia bacterium]
MIKQAGKMMLSAKELEAGGKVKEKEGDAANMVTEYDIAVQRFLLDGIRALLPDAVFFAEEKENDTAVLNEAHCFVIDPIDGTANFVHGYRHSAISVAMISKGEAVLALVYDPYLDEMFTAEKGKGAFVNGKKISVSRRDSAHAIVGFGTSPYRKDLAPLTFRLAEAFFVSCSDVRRSGAASLDLAYLAAGRLDIFFECILSVWDFAAGVLLIKEAGGVVTTMEGAEIDLRRPVSVLAAGAKNHEFAKKLIEKSK